MFPNLLSIIILGIGCWVSTTEPPYTVLLILTTQQFVKAKFHYASWFEAGSKLVADGLEPVCDQLRTNFEPDRVMEFGF